MNYLLVIPLSVAFIAILGGHIYLWFLKEQNKYRGDIECKSESANTVVDLDSTANDTFATKSDLEILALKIENRILKCQSVYERFIFIEVIAIVLLLTLNVL